MKEKDETFETWNSITELYHESFMNLKTYNESYDEFCSSIKVHNPSILEIGCGPGNITKYIFLKRPDFSILATDYSPSMIKKAKSNIPEVEFRVLDCREISSVQGTFDGIIAGFCIPYLTQEEVEILLYEVSKKLSKNGVLYLSYINNEPSKSGIITNSIGLSVFFNYHKKSELENTLNKYNLSIMKTFVVNNGDSSVINNIHTIHLALKNN